MAKFVYCAAQKILEENFDMDIREFLEGRDRSAWQMLDALEAADRAYCRLDGAGRIVAQTALAEDLLGQAPLRSVYEVLGELAARTLRIAIARGETMRTRDVIDGRVVALTICPGPEGHLHYLEPEHTAGVLLRDQLVEQRLRAALSVLALDEPAARQKSVRRMCRLLHEIELLGGGPAAPRALQRCELGALCADAVRFAARHTSLPLRAEGRHLAVVCDQDGIRIAFYHLLTNAILAPGVSQVTVRWGEAPEGVWFEVADDGAVLSEAAFQTLCTASSRVGTASGLPPAVEGHTAGLGLPAVCEIAMRHGRGVSLIGTPEGKAVRVTLAADLPEDPAPLHGPRFVEDGCPLEETELSVLG